MGILVPLALGFSNLPPSLLVPHLPSRAPSQCPCSLDTEMRPQRGGDETQAQSLGRSPLQGAGGKAQEQAWSPALGKSDLGLERSSRRTRRIHQRAGVQLSGGALAWHAWGPGCHPQHCQNIKIEKRSKDEEKAPRSEAGAWGLGLMGEVAWERLAWNCPSGEEGPGVPMSAVPVPTLSCSAPLPLPPQVSSAHHLPSAPFPGASTCSATGCSGFPVPSDPQPVLLQRGK